MSSDQRPESIAVPMVRPTDGVRDQAIERLSAAFAEGALDTDELERRITLVHRSGSMEALERLLADLPANLDSTAMVPATVPSPSQVPATLPSPRQTSLVPATGAPADTGAPGAERTVSVLGSSRRTGRWVVPRRLVVRAVFGNVELDFRNAVLPAGVVDLHVRAVFGNIEITVPPHLVVESSGSAILGSFDQLGRAPVGVAPDAPVLRIRGTTVFANVEITVAPVEAPGLGQLPDRR
jgi:hypothetical protein